jgi:hypothetical protein
MSRGMRLMIVFCVFVLVIVLMMDCAKKTMKKKHAEEEGQGQSWLVPNPAAPLRGA